jgi:hypothetical protein
MAVWDVYLEVEGSPLYATVTMDWTDENRAFEEVLDMVRSTLQIDLIDEGE